MPKSPERCKEIKEEMRNKILHASMLYFAKNGFSGTKISNLAKYIGIGQGTIYIYFESKEELFKEIFQMIKYEKDIKELKILSAFPISARQKIHKLSKAVLGRLEQDEYFAGKIALNTQIVLEKSDYIADAATYQLELYEYTARIIEQGQREGSMGLVLP